MTIPQPEVSGQLARLARDTGEGAGRARLAIHGRPLGPGNPVASLYTDNGWPVFWCDLSSATALAMLLRAQLAGAEPEGRGNGR